MFKPNSLAGGSYVNIPFENKAPLNSKYVDEFFALWSKVASFLLQKQMEIVQLVVNIISMN